MTQTNITYEEIYPFWQLFYVNRGSMKIIRDGKTETVNEGEFSLILDKTVFYGEGGGQVGRKLDFLIQEMNRESNTIASKANDIQIVKATIELKSEIEKIREQVQNIE